MQQAEIFQQKKSAVKKQPFSVLQNGKLFRAQADLPEKISC